MFADILGNYISLALVKCKKNCNILTYLLTYCKIILVQGFCPLKTEIALKLLDFLSDLMLILVLVEFVTSPYERSVLKQAPKKRLLYQLSVVCKTSTTAKGN